MPKNVNFSLNLYDQIYSMLYLSCQLIVILLVIGLAGSVIFALRHVYQKRSIPNTGMRIRYLQLALMFWLFILAFLSFSGFFSNFDARPPILFFAIIPPVFLVFFLFFHRSFSKILLLIPPAWLIRIQGFRIIMELLLWLGYKGNFVPIQMTFEWLNLDIIVGLTAIFAASLFFGKGRFLRFETIIWNFFGILLLFNVFIITVLSAPTSFQIFKTIPDSSFITNVPFIWIPGFIMPFALAMHLFSLKQMFLLNPKEKRFSFGSKLNN